MSDTQIEVRSVLNRLQTMAHSIFYAPRSGCVRFLTALGIAALVGLTPPTTYAASLNISPNPLFLENSVQPNIFFMLDDSGSMGWEFVYNDGTNLSGDDDELNSCYINGVYTPSATCTTNSTAGVFCMGGGTSATNCSSSATPFQLNPNTANKRLFMCPGFNTFAFDINIADTGGYTPWLGKDSGGNPFQNAYLYGGGTEGAPNFNIRNDAYQTGSTTFNLAPVADNVWAYWPWTDSNSDKKYDAGECGDITSASNTGGKKFSDLTVAEKKQFSNWYMYYRKRIYVLKRAASELFNRSQARVGFSTLAGFNGSSASTIVGKQIENVDDISTPLNVTAQTNKTNLLAQLHKMTAHNGTALRYAFDTVGKYYSGINQTKLFNASPNHTGASGNTMSSLSPVLDAAHGGACQQNFTILMTDGFYNSGYGGTSHGNTDNAGGTFDSPSTAFGDTQSDTLGDIAMYYYKSDLYPSLANKVPYSKNFDPLTAGTLTPGDTAANDQGPVPGAGTLMHQHMTSYTVAFGLSGFLDPLKKTASLCDSDPTNACWVGWPNKTPTQMEDTNYAIDDLWHAAYNGRGKFLSARKPSELISALNDAIGDINTRTGTASSVGASGSSASTKSRLYIPQFTSGEWSGALVAIGLIEDSTTHIITLVDVNDWDTAGNHGSKSDAGLVITDSLGATPGTSTYWNSRTVLTTNGLGVGKKFRWSDLTTGAGSQQEALSKDPGTAIIDATEGQKRLEYVRYNRASEKQFGGTYRDRNGSSVLGDIVNSAAVYVGAPDVFYPDTIEPTAPWSAFRASHSTRTPMIYVGANDGMLHGFGACMSATDPGCSVSDLGNEKLAFVPNVVIPKLNRLPDPTYTHSFYVDGTPAISDVFYNGSWHTVLVGGLRAGGQAIYALDITDPSSFSESNAASLVLWEFSDNPTADPLKGDLDLGYTFSQPVIAKMNYNGKWAAIFGNGYNNSDADGNASTTGLGALFVVDIETGKTIRKITVPAGTVATPNGLATPKVIDTNNDQMADIAYAGDLQGNMWKFDLSSPTPGSWTVQKLFAATDPGNVAQPITSKPEVTRHPNGKSGYMVYFGTGKYLESGLTDIANTQTQTFYGIWDSQGAFANPVLKASLQTQTLTTVVSTAGAVTGRKVSNNPITAWGTGGGQNMGWKIDFTLSPGERVYNDPQYISDGRILVVSNIPDSNPCNFGGVSWFYQFNILNGGSPSFVVWDVNHDGDVNVGDNSSGGVIAGVSQPDMAAKPTVLDTGHGRVVVTPGTSTTTAPGTGATNTDKDTDVGIQSWRQVR